MQRNAITMLGPLKSNNVCVEVRTETVSACFLINVFSQILKFLLFINSLKRCADSSSNKSFNFKVYNGRPFLLFRIKIFVLFQLVSELKTFIHVLLHKNSHFEGLFRHFQAKDPQIDHKV